jgi:hypothetical protein
MWLCRLEVQLLVRGGLVGGSQMYKSKHSIGWVGPFSI